MEHTLTLSLPEDVYQSLLEEAEKTGQHLEELAVQRLALSSRSSYPEHDPLDDLVGIMHTNIPDWGTNHDWYIAQGILESMRNDSEDNDPDS